MSNSSKYELLAQQLQALIEGEPDLIAICQMRPLR